MIITEGFAQAELFNRFGMALPDDEPQRPCGAVQINVRLKQLRALAVRRAERGQSLDYEKWLCIYAEGIARRYGHPDRDKTAWDARAACVPFSVQDLDDAITQADYSLEAEPRHTTWSVAMIGQALQVTLKERMEGLTHLGCCEEIADERAQRQKAERKERDSKRRPKKPEGWSQESQRPWENLGISRRTWFRFRRAERIARGTESTPVIYREESLSRAPTVSPEAQPQAEADRAHLTEALDAFFGPPTRPGAWPKPPPIIATMQAIEAPDSCQAAIYKNTELDERLLPPDWRGLAKIRAYWPYDPDKRRAYYEGRLQ